MQIKHLLLLNIWGFNSDFSLFYCLFHRGISSIYVNVQLKMLSYIGEQYV